MRRYFLVQGLMLVLCVAAHGAVAADVLRLGTVKLGAAGPLFVADARGYFKDQGIDARIIDFDSPGLVALAVASGDADIASTGSSAELYTLAAQGSFKIIASQGHEAPSFRINAVVASNKAAAAGLKSYADLAGHSVGIAQVGGPTQYAGALILEKYHVRLGAVRFVALQSNPNVLSAVTGGTVDAAVLPAMVVVPAAERGALKVLGWVGDDAPWQSSAVFASSKILAANPHLVRRFLIAYRRAVEDFHDAFTGSDGRRQDQPTAPAVLAILEKYSGETEAQLRLSIPYVDREARLDVPDIERQLAWFKSQNMLKPGVTLDRVLDRRFVVPVSGS